MPTHPNAELLARFYAAFGRQDGVAMAACYAPDARFSDPIFPTLRGAEPGAMWRMLTSRSEALRVELVDSHADDTAGSAQWIARYTFAPTGRPVVNEVQSTFRFADGLIVEQRDVFDFYGWAVARRWDCLACCSAGPRCCAPRSNARLVHHSTPG